MTTTREHPSVTPPPGDPPGAPTPRDPSPRPPRRRVLAVRGLVALAVVALGAAGFLLLLAARTPAASARTVEITMHHTHFEPTSIEVRAGATIRFVLRNTDPIDHEFIVGDDAVQQRHRVGHEQRHDGSVPGEISVPSGAVATTTFHFDHAGTIAYACHLPGHEAYGMVGVVRVR
jgi:uncharacterized cupredoxin-like copper-binding protein